MAQIRLGLRENWQQFTLLVVVNVFVGAMVGLERTVVPLLAAEDFDLVSRTVILSFLISFGVVKAITNLFAGRLGDEFGRKRVLLAGCGEIWATLLVRCLLGCWPMRWAFPSPSQPSAD